MLRAASLTLLVALVLAGCNGSSGARYGYPESGPAAWSNPQPPTTTYYVPQPTPASSLVLQVTNSSTAFMRVHAETPDEYADVGSIAPGQTVTFDLHELPDWVILTPTATTTNDRGEIPDYPSVTLQLGVDYTLVDGFAAVEWSEEIITRDDTRFDTTFDEEPSTAPGSTAAATTTASKGIVARKAARSSSAIPVQASLGSRTPVTPTSTTQ